MFDIKAAAKRLIDGSVIKGFDGTKLFTPDGMGNYKALWTRDFAYMVTESFELFEEKEDIEKGIEYLIAGARESDGWIPDRVDAEGASMYHAGGEDFPGLDNLDNGPFLVILAAKYLQSIEKQKAQTLYQKWRKTLIRGVDCLPTDENGIILNNTTPLHSPYGFTDTVCKKGLCSMETLLFWESLKALCELEKDFCSKTLPYEKTVEKIEKVFCDIFTDKSGMLISATEDCRHIDIWASCYCIYIGFPISDAQKAKIADYLVSTYDDIVSFGQIKHIPKGEYWEHVFQPYPRDSYQNGAYWATPIAWFCKAIAIKDKKLAEKTLDDALDYFEKYGIFECINGDYKQLDTYVASATSAYAASKDFGKV